MKAWISHKVLKYGIIVVRNSLFFNKEDAINSAKSYNKYKLYTYEPIVDIQEIEINSDQMIMRLLICDGLGSWSNKIFDQIEQNDSTITFGEKIQIEQVVPERLT